MIRKLGRLREHELLAKEIIDKFRNDPSLVNNEDHLWDNVYAKPGDILEWEALSALPFVHHRMMYIGNRQVVHPDLPKSMPLVAKVIVSDLDILKQQKNIFKFHLKCKVPFSRYRSIMNALHGIGEYAYCPILCNCQHIVSSWQGFENQETAIGTAQVMGTIFIVFVFFLLIEYFAERLVFNMKKEVHQLPLFMK